MVSDHGVWANRHTYSNFGSRNWTWHLSHFGDDSNNTSFIVLNRWSNWWNKLELRKNQCVNVWFGKGTVCLKFARAINSWGIPSFVCYFLYILSSFLPFYAYENPVLFSWPSLKIHCRLLFIKTYHGQSHIVHIAWLSRDMMVKIVPTKSDKILDWKTPVPYFHSVLSQLVSFEEVAIPKCDIFWKSRFQYGRPCSQDFCLTVAIAQA